MKHIDELIKKNKTVIIISHKLSTISNADMIYVLKDGKIKEQGKHEELIKYKGEYNNLWNLQMKYIDGKEIE